METASSTNEFAAVVLSLSEAIASRDVDRVMPLLAEDAVFHMHVTGMEPATTPDEIREQFYLIAETWPDFEFEPVRMHIHPGLYVVEWIMHGTLAGSLQVGPRIVNGEGQRLSTAGMDVMTFRDGKLTRKDTYVDVALWYERLVFANAVATASDLAAG
jgi:steroid delta-isomerase-like uncharacterized protein